MWDNALWFSDPVVRKPHSCPLVVRFGRVTALEEKKYPRRPAATITTLTAATGKVLTEFVGFRPTDLGHLKLRPL